MPNYVLGRTHVLAGMGHMINFVKGQPTWVPSEMELEATKIGALPVDGEKLDVLPKEATAAVTPEGDERKGLLFAAFEEIVEGGKREDFTAQGIPSVKAVERVSGIDVSKSEVDALYREFKQVAE